MNHQYIYPNKLLGMPPQKKVDHAIELVPGVVLIAHAPN